jgi:sterol desaturase/sphingolipid hydroxylase (fatty acid hydroxylase superfamily)
MEKKQAYRMYSNRWLELLSLSGPNVMIPFHLSLVGLQLYIGVQGRAYGDITLILGLFIFGMLLWTLAEYVLHRYLFHFKNDHPWIKAFHFAMHGYHHEVPHDANRLFMPPVPALLFLGIFWILFFAVVGNGVWFLLPGFEFGYLLYSFIHFSVHTRKAPKGFEKLWHHHILHHYKEPEKAFGVSSRFWDRVFRTLPDRQTK